MRRAAYALALGVATACGREAAPPTAAVPTTDARPQLYTCSMHPQVLQDHPGQCPICGMALTPIRADAATGSDRTLTIDPAIVQNMGVRTALVATGPLDRSVRAVGTLEEAEPHRHDVSLRVNGWVEHLYAATEGMHLARGAPLFDLYSPELQSAVGELIAARRGGAHDLEAAVTRKLQSLGVDASEIARLGRLATPPRAVAFTSPIDGHLTMKNLVAGSAVRAGDTVLRIVDHSVLWLDAQVYERDLPLVRVGQEATATLVAQPEAPVTGEVVFIHPHLDMTTRTARVRIAVRNPALTLRPGMWARVTLTTVVSPDATLVPREAVIDTGLRHIAFVALGDGHFEGRDVTLGVVADDGRVQVLAGLAPGESVVTSGQFLLDAESRTREAIAKYLAAGAGHSH